MKKIFFKISVIFLLSFGFWNCKEQINNDKQHINSLFNPDDLNNNPACPSVISGMQVEKKVFTGNILTRDQSGKFAIGTDRFICIVEKKPFSINFINYLTGDSIRIPSSKNSGSGITNAVFENLIADKIIPSDKKDNSWQIVTNKRDKIIKMEIVNEGTLKLVVESDNHPKPLELNADVQGPFYGGGERFLSTRLDGRNFRNQPNDRLFLKQFDETELKKYEPTYISIPFVLNPNGFGLYVDNAETTGIGINEQGDLINIKTDNNIAVLYIFAGKTPKDVLKSFTSIVGRQPMIPRWGLGIWANLLEGRDSVLSKANRLKRNNIPVDAVWIFDLDDPSTSTGWTHWSKGYYGNPGELTDTLHKLDLKVLTYLHPYENKELLYYKFNNPVYDYCFENNLLLKVDTLFDNNRFATMNPYELLDFYNDKTYQWWKKVIKEILVDDNFDGWMEDFGDISYKYDFELKNWTSLDYKTNYSFSNEALANLYPLLYHKTTFSIAKTIKPEMIGFCRSGSAGSAPFTSLVWGGDQTADWDKKTGYPCLVTAGISAGLSGYGIWAPDILCNSPSLELWKRWVQLGAFSPTMRDHLWSNNPKSIDLWTDESTLQYFKKYALIHKALEPYLFSLAGEASETGIPVIRHMMLEYPEDQAVYDCEYQYMLGSDLIVAPVVEENAWTKTVYLPEGEWLYFWTKKVFTGKNWIEVEAPVDRIPFFIKKDSSNELVNSFVRNISD